jgi:hypothetical protein
VPGCAAGGAEDDAFLAVREVLAAIVQDVENGERVEVSEVGNVYVVPDAGAGTDDDGVAVADGGAGVGGDLDGEGVEELR